MQLNIKRKGHVTVVIKWTTSHVFPDVATRTPRGASLQTSKLQHRNSFWAPSQSTQEAALVWISAHKSTEMMLHLGLDGIHHHFMFWHKSPVFYWVICLLYPLEYIKLQVRALEENFSLPAKKSVPNPWISLGSGFNRSYDSTTKF